MLIKRAIAMMIISCMLLAGVTIIVPTASASTEAAPRVQTLYAGQTIPVGTVSVWNDENSLHVVYTITAPWKMSESHLMAASTLAGIPQTAKGNPIPGKFTWGGSYDPMVSSVEFVISLSENGWSKCTWLNIAAHAVVKNTCSGQVETAWAKGCAFEGKNWATYFTYDVQGWVLADRLYVNSNNALGVNSVVLKNGGLYKFNVRGTWLDHCGPGGINSKNGVYCDAMYTTQDNWATHNDAPTGTLYGPYISLGSYDANQCEMQVNGQFLDWGAYSATHQYSMAYTGAGSSVNFKIFDGNAMTNTLLSWYGDNWGTLQVDIYVWA
jgi:hypothetical protein